MKDYLFIFEDKNGNELKRRVIQVKDKKESLEIAERLKGHSALNDLHRIKTKKVSF